GPAALSISLLRMSAATDRESDEGRAAPDPFDLDGWMVGVSTQSERESAAHPAAGALGGSVIDRQARNIEREIEPNHQPAGFERHRVEHPIDELLSRSDLPTVG